jgi:SNF2 family DNA or RNA helicase
MVEVGSYVYAKELKKNVKILDIVELWGHKIILALDTSTNKLLKLSEEDIELQTKNNVYEFKYILYSAKIKNEISNGILSPISGSILPLPHQIYALKRAISSDNIRYILADEVGLGKTIEAGLILKELKIRGLIKRILIITPKGLVMQWKEELREKFNEEFNIILPQYFDSLKKIYGDGNIWAKFDQVITSHDSVKPVENRAGWTKEKIDLLNNERFVNLISSGWDLIIIDEAHRLSGSSSDVARYKLGKALSSAAPYLLLLTATPHQGKSDSFLRLLRFLDEEAFPNERAITREVVSPYVIRTEKREAIDFDGNKLFKNRYTKIIKIKWTERHELQRLLYEKVTDYVARGYNRAEKERKNYIGFLMVLMQRLVTSSTRAIREFIERRIEILNNQYFDNEKYDIEDIYDGYGEEMLEELIATTSFDIKKEIEELKEILAIAQQAEHQFIDAKLETLYDIIFKIRMEENEAKFLIFTEFIGTQNYLNEMLSKKGYKVVLLNGSMDMDERKKVLMDFKEDADILISTDAGGEGLNLQFCHIVINYDMPWNPMKIEQRIGRVDRIGQQRDVLVFNFVLEDTIENRVREILEEKLQIIYKEFGVDKLSDVLDSFESGVDFTDVYIKSIAHPEYMDVFIKSVEEEIREKTRNFSELKEILKNKRELNLDLIRDLPSQDTMYYLKEMYKYKCLSIGEEIKLDLNTINLFDERIKSLLNIPEFSIKDKIPRVNLSNKFEKGYWSLWEVNISDSERYCKVFPVFINSTGDYRPATSKALFEYFLKENIDFDGEYELRQDTFDIISKVANDIGYNYFSEMKQEYFKNVEKELEKYKTAYKLKKEAAMRIGIESIKKHRLSQIEMEEKNKLNLIENKKKIVPNLKLLYIIYVE